jgi:hypothetical protein
MSSKKLNSKKLILLLLCASGTWSREKRQTEIGEDGVQNVRSSIQLFGVFKSIKNILAQIPLGFKKLHYLSSI